MCSTRWAGGRRRTSCVELNGEYGLHLDPEAVAFAKRECFMRYLDRIELHRGGGGVRAHADGKVPMAVATGGTRMVVEKTLQAVGIDRTCLTKW